MTNETRCLAEKKNCVPVSCQVLCCTMDQISLFYARHSGGLSISRFNQYKHLLSCGQGNKEVIIQSTPSLFSALKILNFLSSFGVLNKYFIYIFRLYIYLILYTCHIYLLRFQIIYCIERPPPHLKKEIQSNTGILTQVSEFF